MTEPPRLLDESNNELELSLLRAGSNLTASPELRSKTLAALGLGSAVIASGAAVGSGAVVAAGATSKSVGGLLSALSLKVALGGALVAGFVAAPIYYLTASGPAPVARLPKPVALLAQRSGSAVVGVPNQAEALPISPSSAARAEAPTEVAGPKLPPAEALRAELAQLDAARARLASGRPDEALRLLDAYARSTPRGRLKLEAEVLRIDALAKSGRSAQAKARAQAFLARYPNSVLAARVRRIAEP